PKLNWDAQIPLAGNILISGMFLLVYYGIPAMYGIALLSIIIRRRRFRSVDRSRLALVSLVGLAFWATVVGRPDLWHVAYAIGPFVLFAALCVSAIRRMAGSRTARIVICAVQAATIASLMVIGQGGALGRLVWKQESTLLPENMRRNGKQLVVCRGPRIGEIAMEPEQAVFTRSVVSYIRGHTDADDTILDLSKHGLLYFLCDRRCPTRFYLLSHVGDSPVAAEMVKEVLSRDRLPRYIIQAASNQALPGELGQLVRDYYVPETRIGDLELLRCVDVNGHRKAS
ncbi:MAG TPA: hypothetical protein VMV94_21700, partial [Phycisphaerae bacterium]|nr:hypothetical protein [Phycisphaerae bacterium]